MEVVGREKKPKSRLGEMGARSFETVSSKWTRNLWSLEVMIFEHGSFVIGGQTVTVLSRASSFLCQQGRVCGRLSCLRNLRGGFVSLKYGLS